jgi:hypothetical protein
MQCRLVASRKMEESTNAHTRRGGPMALVIQDQHDVSLKVHSPRLAQQGHTCTFTWTN